MPPSTVLTVNDLAKSFGPDEIFRNVSFHVADREHVALVGVNGAGKSTLLKIIAGLDTATAGEIAVARGARVAVLAQEPRFESDRTVRREAQLAFDEALSAMKRMRQLETEMQAASGHSLNQLLEEYERLSLHFEASGGFDVEHRTDEVLMGLGFRKDQMDEPVRTLSGGQRTRVALAKALLSDPDLLLLDEPTNHLDLGMLEWLEGFLASWRGSFLVVSHDRYFLDRVTNRTLDLSFGRLEDYPASYARYLNLREERLARRLQEYEEQHELIERTEDFIRRYKAGQRSREAKGRQTRLDRLERIDRPQEQASLTLRVQPTIRSGREVLTTTPTRVGYLDSRGERVLLATPELRVERGDRVAIIGPNGSGKSTLLKSIVGELEPLSGRLGFGTNVKVGYYAQGHEGLPAEGTPFSILVNSQPMSEEGARTYLARFLFRGEEVHRSITALSGGERSRLALACLLVEGANLLILDEPTNHLDIQSRETLEEMLTEYDGTVIFVSHDRFFIDRVATRIWDICDGKLHPYLGNYTDMLSQRAKAASPVVSLTSEKVRPVKPAPEKIAPRRSGQETESRLQKRLVSTERDISRLEGRLNELSDEIAIAGIDGDGDRLERLGAEYAVAETNLDEAYQLWHELNENIESLVTTAPV